MATGEPRVVRIWRCRSCDSEFKRSDNFRKHCMTAKHRRNAARRRQPTRHRLGEWV